MRTGGQWSMRTRLVRVAARSAGKYDSMEITKLGLTQILGL
jgi:hypothetical protein